MCASVCWPTGVGTWGPRGSSRGPSSTAVSEAGPSGRGALCQGLPQPSSFCPDGVVVSLRGRVQSCIWSPGGLVPRPHPTLPRPGPLPPPPCPPVRGLAGKHPAPDSGGSGREGTKGQWEQEAHCRCRSRSIWGGGSAALGTPERPAMALPGFSGVYGLLIHSPRAFMQVTGGRGRPEAQPVTVQLWS